MSNTAAIAIQNRERQLAILVYCTKYLKQLGFENSSKKLISECPLALESYDIPENLGFEKIFVDFQAAYELKYGSKPVLIKPKGSKTEKKSNPRASVVSMLNNAINIGNNPEENDTGPVAEDTPLNQDSETLVTNLLSEVTRPTVKLSDVVGNVDGKAFLEEALIWPKEHPYFFGPGQLQSWRSGLLFGPSGSGKTLLTAGFANHTNSAVLHISASSIVSKWRGESEKLVKAMFRAARLVARTDSCILFIDEIHALFPKSSAEHDADGARRMKAQLLVELEGVGNTESRDFFFLAASHVPWEIDEAVLRRIERKVRLRMPGIPERIQMILNHFKGIVQYDDYDPDIKNICTNSIENDSVKKPTSEIKHKTAPENVTGQTKSNSKVLPVIQSSKLSQSKTDLNEIYNHRFAGSPVEDFTTAEILNTENFVDPSKMNRSLRTKKYILFRKQLVNYIISPQPGYQLKDIYKNRYCKVNALKSTSTPLFTQELSSLRNNKIKHIEVFNTLPHKDRNRELPIYDDLEYRRLSLKESIFVKDRKKFYEKNINNPINLNNSKNIVFASDPSKIASDLTSDLLRKYPNLAKYVVKLDGYTGSDIRCLCREAVMTVIRGILHDPDSVSKLKQLEPAQFSSVGIVVGIEHLEAARLKIGKTEGASDDAYKEWERKLLE